MFPGNSPRIMVSLYKMGIDLLSNLLSGIFQQFTNFMNNGFCCHIVRADSQL